MSWFIKIGYQPEKNLYGSASGAKVSEKLQWGKQAMAICGCQEQHSGAIRSSLVDYVIISTRVRICTYVRCGIKNSVHYFSQTALLHWLNIQRFKSGLIRCTCKHRHIRPNYTLWSDSSDQRTWTLFSLVFVDGLSHDHTALTGLVSPVHPTMEQCV